MLNKNRKKKKMRRDPTSRKSCINLLPRSDIPEELKNITL